MKNITVLMPVHGGGEYLEETIRSVLNQSFHEFEFLIILDRASDTALKIIESFNFDTRIKTATAKGQGIVSALNTGIDLSESDFIARIDSDDLMAKDRMAKQKDFLDRNPKVVCVGSCIQLIDEAGRELYPHHNPEKHRKILNEMSRRTPMAHPSVMYRTAAVQEVGAYREFFKYAEDYDLWVRLGEIGELHNIQETLTYYRIHSNQLSKVKTIEQGYATLAVQTSEKLRRKNQLDLPDLYRNPSEWVYAAGIKSISGVETSQAEKIDNQSKTKVFAFKKYLVSISQSRKLRRMRPSIKDVLNLRFQESRKQGTRGKTVGIFLLLLVLSPYKSSQKFLEYVIYHGRQYFK